jgi:hypothetical protein
MGLLCVSIVLMQGEYRTLSTGHSEIRPVQWLWLAGSST